MELGTTLKLMSPKVAGGVLEVRTKLTLACSAATTAARELVIARAQGQARQQNQARKGFIGFHQAPHAVRLSSPCQEAPSPFHGNI